MKKLSLNEWFDGEVVEYDNGQMKGRGKIVGAATTPMAAIGSLMIVEDLSGNIPNEEYPYTHFACNECHLKKA